MSRAFEKWEALANDFLIFLGDEPVLEEAFVRLACHRRLGAGADGVIGARLANPSTVRLHNANGGSAEFSGNGFRCVAAALLDRMPGATSVTLRCGKVAVEGRRAPGGASLEIAPGSLGEPRVIEAGEAVAGRLPAGLSTGRVQTVVLGNPHLIVWIEDAAGAGDAAVGAALDALRHGIAGFETGINVSLAAWEGPGRLRLATWERGVGRTPACASAACAAVWAASRSGDARGSIVVVSDGGSLRVGVDGDTLELTGPARRVYRGELAAADLGGAA